MTYSDEVFKSPVESCAKIEAAVEPQSTVNLEKTNLAVHMASTNALKKLNRQLQVSLDSITLFCHAVPFLRQAVGDSGVAPVHSLPVPDFFNESAPAHQL